jgi:hypothetical protein
VIAVHALLAVLATPGNRFRIGEFDLVGPVSGLVLDSGRAGETRFTRAVDAGERLRVAAPVSVEDADSPIVPEIRWTRGGALDPDASARGSARFAGWRTDEAAESIGRLPPGLLARPRPPVGAPEVRASVATLALLGACFVLGFAARKRRAAALAVGVLGSALVLRLGWTRPSDASSTVSVLECQADEPAALGVSAEFGRTTALLTELEEYVLETPDGRPRLVWTETPEPSTGESDRWSANAPGSAIVLLRRVEIGDRTPRRQSNRGLPLAECWIRDEGAWSARGGWPSGAPLPDPAERPPPPGWLQAGLPQGVSILLGRFETETGSSFVRVAGF